MRSSIALLATWALTQFGAPCPLAAQSPCPPRAAELVEEGWKAYRDGAIDLAERRFTRSDNLCAGNLDAKVGLGYTNLRHDRPPAADSLFRIVLAADPLNADAWAGRALSTSRLGYTETSREAAERAIALDSTNQAARLILDRLSPDWDRPDLPPRTRPDTLEVEARIRGSSFEVPDGDEWSPFYVKGVNMGVALPGRFPAEFPVDSSLYARWLTLIGGMNANTVRLYTILPPEFYRALLGYNLTHPDSPLYLVHGVWTELPPDDDFEDDQWKSEFRAEMRRVVDLVHGGAGIAPRRGHASGRYDADVSRWTLGYIIGREWEPYAVVAFNEKHPGPRAYNGKFLNARGPVTDVWMAEQSDYMLAYEVEKWNTIRPIAYTNWPTLDPLHHPTEATVQEEQEWRQRKGRPFLRVSREYDNDAIGLDANLTEPTGNNPAGWFASYHAYPYYPDFMLYDPGYGTASSSDGRSNYFGYLQELVKHHKGMPVLIAEYGVPSSRGMAHWQPQGWTHGGHDEQEMAMIDARLTREIHESGAAGGIIFAWMDEWFKKNWVVADLQIPAGHIPRWRNVMDAEQNYGILGMYAGHPDSSPELGGDPEQWTRGPALMQGNGPFSELHLRGNEAYVYLGVKLNPEKAALEWDSGGVMIGIDTYHGDTGQHTLPGLEVRSEPGFEFLVHLRSPRDAQLLIAPGYDPYGGPPDSTGDDRGLFYSRPAATRNRYDGTFDSMFVITNRARFGRDGIFFPARGYNRGRLQYGTAEESTLSDWYHDPEAGLIEIRLPWGLLNVTDPSTRTVLDDASGQGDFGTAVTDGFRFGVILYNESANRTVIGALPALGEDQWSSEEFPLWTWDTWEIPEYYARLKPVYYELRDTWAELR